jgi:16S rRNA (cytosine1402-N4)-methyltransferase
MLEQSREALAMTSGEVFCDCTLGGGGHALTIAPDISPGGLLIGIDQDVEALNFAHARLKAALSALSDPSPARLAIIKGNFADLDELLIQVPVPGIDGFLFDLGVSSHQLDIPSRGFSYARDAPLDMRMDPGTQTTTAAEIINNTTAADLAWILRNFGEERHAVQIAHRIVKARVQAPITSTSELVRIVKSAIPARYRRSGGNPAKRTFQALRIAVNRELDVLEAGLNAAVRWLNPAGRLVVISYHSLEDRIVKNLFNELSKSCICPPEAPICTCGIKPIFSRISKRALVATSEQREDNPRSKSAKLRWAIKSPEEDPSPGGDLDPGVARHRQ